jgi:EmrB/QacA subfamily drug resistance transporter
MYTTTTGVQISHRQLLAAMLGVMLGVLLAALDQTVVGPAMFKIIRDLRGLEHYAWVTTAYLLTSTIAVPIFGKLGDLYGRKWLFVGGMVVFMIGSALSGLASGTGEFNLAGLTVSGLTVGMAQLIAFRALQGIGAGMMNANAFTIIGDLVPPAERGRWQGLFGAVFGLASVIGPTVGGYITDNIGWQWVFYVNLPVGLLAIAVVVFTFPPLHVAREGHQPVVDWLGVTALIAASVPLLLGLSLGGSKDFPWDAPQTIGLFVVGGLFLVAFLVAEARASEPIIPLDLFKNRVFTLSVLCVVLVGVGMFGSLINLPLFIQGVQGDNATNSGNSITPMMFGMIVFSVASGQILSRTGRYRILGIVGMILISTGMFLLSTMDETIPRWQTIGYMIIMGMGLGIAMPLYTLIVQNAFPVQRLGVVTSALTFFRSIGGTVGVAILGTVVNNRFQSEYTAGLPPTAQANPLMAAFLKQLSPQALISPETITALRAQLAARGLPAAQVDLAIQTIQAPIKHALDVATTQSFFIGGVIVAFAVLATAFIPELALRKRGGAPALAGVEGAEHAGIEMGEGLATVSAQEGQELAEGDGMAAPDAAEPAVTRGG